MTIQPRAFEEAASAPNGADVSAYLVRLASDGFSGEILSDPGTRTVHATDNSIYRLEPAAVIFPRHAADVTIAVKLAAEWQGRVPLTARGGATGTNGQSLTRGVVVDTSRHMTRVLALDTERRTVTVEPGVVLDALNTFLKPHGLFFPPTVSTASRATLGGMVATDASGKGSRIYGRTSNYVERLDTVLSDGTTFSFQSLDRAALDAVCQRDDLAGHVHREARSIVAEHRALIGQIFPVMNRGLTGYNLRDIEQPEDRFALQYALAGSEGTLAITTAITLRLRSIPKHRTLAVLGYRSFDAALAHVTPLLEAEPAAVEILDERVIGVARGDILWSRIETLLDANGQTLGGLNFVEFVGDSAQSVAEGLSRLAEVLEQTPESGFVIHRAVSDPRAIADLWELRKKAVGLLGRLPGNRQGVPYVEDTAVPPERLVAYVSEFRALLDSHGLAYGMFGHADVGCLHVRPALDMRDPNDRRMIRLISDEVAALTKRHGGLIWGEHGRGFRGEFSPLFFGPVLYRALCRLKAAFDPHDMLNPGKLARPMVEIPVERIDAVPFRGARDAEVTGEHAQSFDRALACNGNGACHAIDRFDAMCPSFKATGDRAQSPKGRASLLREWSRLDGIAASTGNTPDELEAIEASLHASLSTCLSCKACASQCPIRVDIPAMRSRFLERYHERHGRTPRDRLMGRLEGLGDLAARAPRLANALMGSAWWRKGFERVFRLVDLPAFSPASPAQMLAHGSAIPAKGKVVLLAQDSFTTRFEAEVPAAAVQLLRALGYRAELAPVIHNGKVLHGLGLRRRFDRVAGRARKNLDALRGTDRTVVGVEAVTALMHRHEYVEGRQPDATAGLPTVDAFLAEEIKSGRLAPPRLEGGARAPYRILLHCTEKTAEPRVAERWRTVFEAFGLEAQFPSVGCCGMAGLFGHQAEHQRMSRRLFDMSWRERIEGADADTVLATGFSCRCQTERFAGFRPRHPVEALLQHLPTAGHAPC